MSNSSSIQKIFVDHDQQILSILWKDDETAEYQLDGLRRVCPCVFCRGGHENMGKKMDAQELIRKGKRTWKITSIKPVGNYALQFTWSDGHNSGLYQFGALRQLWDEYLNLLTPRDL